MRRHRPLIIALAAVVLVVLGLAGLAAVGIVVERTGSDTVGSRDDAGWSGQFPDGALALKQYGEGDPGAPAGGSPETTVAAKDAELVDPSGDPADDAATSILPALPGASGGGRMLQRTGDMRIRVEEGDVPAATSRVVALTTGYGGYVVASQVSTSGGDEGAFADLTVKIPARSYDQAIVRFGELGEVKAVNTGAQDVTSEFVDLKARLRHYRAVEARLMGFLSRTTTINEALAVQQRIEKTQLQVEQLEGQLKAMGNQVAYGTLTVSLFEPDAVVAATVDETGFVDAMKHSWQLIVSGFGTIIVVFGAVLPFAVVIALVAGLTAGGVRAATRMKARTQS